MVKCAGNGGREEMDGSKELQMEGEEGKFPAFPFKPYPIQIDFMNALYRALDHGGLAMLESPTGTGKTLSIICSALQWLVDQKQRKKSETKANSDQNQTCGDQSDEPDWMRDFIVEKTDPDPSENNNKKKKPGHGFRSSGKKGNCRDLLANRREEEKETKSENLKERSGLDVSEEKEFLLEDYESEDEGKSKRKSDCGSLSFSSSDDDEEEEAELKVYFCSRTHSQLSQFVKELKKTVFAKELKVICLGARKNLCINEEVLKLGSSTRINERCLELQKNKKQGASKTKILDGGRIRRTKASSGCPALRKHKLQKEFRTEVSQQDALDIEDLIHLGKQMGTCPYYGSRNVVPVADLVVLPYQSLLLKSARESLGLNLNKSVIIIDEAHNLADSLTSMYDSRITYSQLKEVHRHLELYFERFQNLLGAGNRRYIQTMMVLSQAFLQVLLDKNDSSPLIPCQYTEKSLGQKSAFTSSMAINDFLFALEIDNINLVKLRNYIKESNIIHKVSGYGAKMVTLQKDPVLDDGGKGAGGRSILSGFQALDGMLLSLANNDGDGRIIISRRSPNCAGEEGCLKYVMLAGEKIFSEIMDQAHAVVLAGGTLQPIEETRERLFPYLCADRMHLFSCGHIIAPESILPIAVSCGPSGRSFDFSYTSRKAPGMIEELGRLLCNLVMVVPEGIVVFLPSFEYEGQVHDVWKSSGILDRIMKKKRVFREPISNVDVEVVLREYKESICALSSIDHKETSLSQSGAILLAIVGGKISEGINFSDGMGRCVVMVGLPYASPFDIELMERVKHIDGLGDSTSAKTKPLLNNGCHDGNIVEAGFDVLRNCKRRGREYYENLCMKAVNQSIGRAIRHINDYASILLVDSRYGFDPSKRSFSHPTDKLPQWIKGRLVSGSGNYGQVHRLLHQFFKLNKQKAFQ